MPNTNLTTAGNYFWGGANTATPFEMEMYGQSGQGSSGPMGQTNSTQTAYNQSAQDGSQGNSSGVSILNPNIGMTGTGNQANQSSSPNSVGGLLQQGLGSIAKNSGTFNNVTSTVNQAGADYLGMASNTGVQTGSDIADAASGIMQGPGEGSLLDAGTAATNGITGGATLSGMLGGAGMGAAIGEFNPLVKNKTGGEVGGAVGGAIGNAIGMSFDVPIIGGIVGSAIGSTVGGMFGAGKSTTASEFSGALTDNTGNIGNISFGSEGGDTSTAKNVSNSVQQMTQVLAKNGINLQGINLHGGLNTKQAGGGFIDFGNAKATPDQMAANRITFDASDPNSINQAVTQLGNSILKMQGYNTTMNNYTTAIPGLQGSSMLVNGGEPTVQANNNPNGAKTFADFLTQFRQSTGQ